VLEIIVGLLKSDYASLRCCSLVCRAWTYVAQTRLFAASTLCERVELDAFVALLDGSPHIAALVRHVAVIPTISEQSGIAALFDSVILKLAFRLPKLDTLHFSRLPYHKLSCDAREAFANGFQSIYALSFRSVSMRGSTLQLADMFAECFNRPNLKRFKYINEWRRELLDQDVDEPSVMAPARHIPNRPAIIDDVLLEYIGGKTLQSLATLVRSTGLGLANLSLLATASGMRAAAQFMSSLGSSLQYLNLHVWTKMMFPRHNVNEGLEGRIRIYQSFHID